MTLREIPRWRQLAIYNQLAITLCYPDPEITPEMLLMKAKLSP